ncbi:MAG: class I SAM-dependent methyltransferase family protein [Thaumarchaeota archaeon]|jgi:tRNA (guanine37-N1)-methyltransferase|nr:class I SAM-dependent methyltransferase family protein [Nitrososphaerota archaeon]MBT3743697.1 class I SAM-dependent methyltransferase family protein [Nitrososphaerota archaeon]MBT4056941.1 class I SAM-dependent methyltransferase family protein [Nitrososphaerota archaeon]MBT4176102.1 class I SAM-dependent methyltransferase family protein [Nitrososphaerota archaeon]MBT4509839.1 class I SAM-dependent methyltransferase family protein [Nitrososphaerota archaeon]
MLKRVLQDVLSEEENEQLISAFDQIGDIIVVRIPDSLVSKKQIIGKTLLEQVSTANSVFYQSSPVEGDFRTRKLEVIAGEDKTQTEYKENGCRFIVDVEKAFFSPRLSTERERIAGLVKDGEVIINMFGGVGMFSVLAAKNMSCTVYNIDLNPVAAQLCKENVQINKLKGEVISLNGDATEVINEQLVGKADRVLMLLPERSDEFLDAALTGLKDEGIIHYYSHMHADKKQDAGKLSEEHFMSVNKTNADIITSRNVRPVGPRFYQTVVDVKISKN